LQLVYFGETYGISGLPLRDKLRDHVRQMSASYPARFPVYPRLHSKPVRSERFEYRRANIFSEESRSANHAPRSRS